MVVRLFLQQTAFPWAPGGRSDMVLRLGTLPGGLLALVFGGLLALVFGGLLALGGCQSSGKPADAHSAAPSSSHVATQGHAGSSALSWHIPPQALPSAPSASAGENAHALILPPDLPSHLLVPHNPQRTPEQGFHNPARSLSRLDQAAFNELDSLSAASPKDRAIAQAIARLQRHGLLLPLHAEDAVELDLPISGQQLLQWLWALQNKPWPSSSGLALRAAEQALETAIQQGQAPPDWLPQRWVSQPVSRQDALALLFYATQGPSGVQRWSQPDYWPTEGYDPQTPLLTVQAFSNRVPAAYQPALAWALRRQLPQRVFAVTSAQAALQPNQAVTRGQALALLAFTLPLS